MLQIPLGRELSICSEENNTGIAPYIPKVSKWAKAVAHEVRLYPWDSSQT